MIQIHAIEKQQHALLVAMQSFLIKVLLVTLCMYKSVHLIFFLNLWMDLKVAALRWTFPCYLTFVFSSFIDLRKKQAKKNS